MNMRDSKLFFVSKIMQYHLIFTGKFKVTLKMTELKTSLFFLRFYFILSMTHIVGIQSARSLELKELIRKFSTQSILLFSLY